MVNIAERSLNEVDVVLWLVEPSNFIGAGEKHIIEQLKMCIRDRVRPVHRKPVFSRLNLRSDVENTSFHKDLPDSAVPVQLRQSYIKSSKKCVEDRICGQLSARYHPVLSKAGYRVPAVSYTHLGPLEKGTGTGEVAGADGGDPPVGLCRWSPYCLLYTSRCV